MRLSNPWIANPWIAAMLSGFFGAVAGVGIANLAAIAAPWRSGDYLPGRPAAAPAGPAAVAETPETSFSFGTIAVGASGSHSFVIKNAGDAPLELTKGATSCTCTVSDFEESEGGSSAAKTIAPGESTRLEVKWRGKGDGGPYRQSASVLTSDPRRRQIAFVVEGTVVPPYKAVPSSVALPKLTPDMSHEAAVRVFTYGAEPPAIDSLALADEKTAGFYAISSTPLAADEIAAEKAATGGFKIDVQVRPGLPLGSVRQGIKATFRMPDEVVAEIPIEGVVAGDFALAGAGWNSARESLMLGTVSGRTGSRATLFLTVKGPYRDAVRPSVREVVPACLQVAVDEAKPVGGGGVVRIPLTVTIPPGTAAVDHAGTLLAPAGRIVLDTGHPDTPTLEIKVCVTVLP